MNNAFAMGATWCFLMSMSRTHEAMHGMLSVVQEMLLTTFDDEVRDGKSSE